MLRLFMKSLSSLVMGGENYRRLMDSIRTKNNQRGDIERDKSVEHIKRISVNEILRQNE